MITKYYIDESGSTGDLIITKDNLNFSSQKYFTLACIGLEDEKLIDLENFIKELKKKYKIQNKELKFGKIKHIFGKKIGFVLELLKYIEEDSRILIEIVDKKYIISTNIVNCLINPPYFQPNKNLEEEKQLHLFLAQWVYDYVPNTFFIDFSNIARNPSKEGLEKLFNDLKKIANESNNKMSESILGYIEESIDDYNLMQEQLKNNENTREAYTYFLPLPDNNKRGELIGILPNISSFTNIHARLNYLHSHDLSSITIIHDNHAHFDEIIKHYHQTAIDDKTDKNKLYEMADFRFSNIGDLEFQDDKNQIGLQIADIFAGLINKAIPYILNEEKKLNEKENAILLQILTSLYYQKAINFVLPTFHNMEKIFPLLENHLQFIMAMAFRGVNKEMLDEALLKPNKFEERNI
jgi:hypothetical protein